MRRGTVVALRSANFFYDFTAQTAQSLSIQPRPRSHSNPPCDFKNSSINSCFIDAFQAIHNRGTTLAQ